MSNHPDIFSRVDAALDTIRPYLEADGGNVKLVEIIDNKIVKLQLSGACGACPMSSMTMKAGIEEAIKREVPEILSVEAISLSEEEFS
jgi:Fe-S cluster biogenesis protein NfuA